LILNIKRIGAKVNSRQSFGVINNPGTQELRHFPLLVARAAAAETVVPYLAGSYWTKAMKLQYFGDVNDYIK